MLFDDLHHIRLALEAISADLRRVADALDKITREGEAVGIKVEPDKPTTH